MKKFLSTPAGRAVRAIIAVMLATGFTAVLNQITTLPVDPVWVPVFTGGIMAAEKYLRDNGWLTEPEVKDSE